MDRSQGRRLRAGDRRHADQGRRQLLEAAEQPAQRVRHRSRAARLAGPAPASARCGSRPVPSLTDVKYEEWVAKSREFVDKESNGQIAYVHIRSMNQPSLRKFQNEINQFSNKKGIVVDIRFNGGGNIDQELIDILERRPVRVLEQPVGLAHVGTPPAPGDRRAEGDADQQPLRLRQRSHADGLPRSRPRPHRRQPDRRRPSSRRARTR